MPTQGDSTSQEAEDLFTTVCQAAATADGNGTVADVAGLNGPQTLELNNAGTGTTSVYLEGSFDGITWYACGYMQVDNQASPIRSVAAIAVTASPFAHVYAVLDSYSRLRARMSGSAGSVILTATVRGTGV